MLVKVSLVHCSKFLFSLCGSDEDLKVFDTCELHGEVRYPTGNECPEIYRARDGVRYIAECTKREEESCKVTSTGLGARTEKLDVSVTLRPTK